MAQEDVRAIALEKAFAQVTQHSRNEGGSPFTAEAVIDLAKKYEGYIDGSGQREDDHRRKIDLAARTVHEVNRVLQLANGEEAFAIPWGVARPEIRRSAKIGVEAIYNDPDITPEGLHDSWCETKRAEGWVHADIRNDTLKHHPCLVPYSELPEAQRLKDAMFQAVVRSILGY